MAGLPDSDDKPLGQELNASPGIINRRKNQENLQEPIVKSKERKMVNMWVGDKRGKLGVSAVIRKLCRDERT